MKQENVVTQIEGIVRDYFSSVIFIDDEIDLFSEDISVSDDEINFNEVEDEDSLEMMTEEIACTSEEDDDIHRPREVVNQFMEEGFIISPYKYDGNKPLPQSSLDKIIKNARMVILDWNLENTKLPTDMGKKAMGIIDTITEGKYGLKCCVIYTSCEDAKQQLKETDKYEFYNDESFDMFVPVDEEKSNLIGFFIDKKVSPEEIINGISRYLLNNKSVILNFLNNAVLFQHNMDKVLSKFNKPFEIALYSQIFTSDMNNLEISSFLSNFLVSTVQGEEIMDEQLFFEIKSNSINNFLSNKSDEELADIIKKIDNDFGNKLNGELLNERNNYVLCQVIKQAWNDTDNFTSVKNELSTSLKAEINEIASSMSGKKIRRQTTQTFICSMFLDQYKDDESIKELLAEQLYTFTNLLKYKQFDTKKIETGTILKNKNWYLLCITPYCDTVRIEAIDNKYKFLIGKEISSGKMKNSLNSRGSQKYDDMIVPVNNEVKFIRWDFYNTIVLEETEFNLEEDIVATLKKEYIQKILNKYLVYQSRAGVSELFYKESDYVNSFWDVVNEHLA